MNIEELIVWFAINRDSIIIGLLFFVLSSMLTIWLNCRRIRKWWKIKQRNRWQRKANKLWILGGLQEMVEIQNKPAILLTSEADKALIRQRDKIKAARIDRQTNRIISTEAWSDQITNKIFSIQDRFFNNIQTGVEQINLSKDKK